MTITVCAWFLRPSAISWREATGDESVVKIMAGRRFGDELGRKWREAGRHRTDSTLPRGPLPTSDTTSSDAAALRFTQRQRQHNIQFNQNNNFACIHDDIASIVATARVPPHWPVIFIPTTSLSIATSSSGGWCIGSCCKMVVFASLSCIKYFT